MRKVIILLFVNILLSCSKTDFYSEITADCNFTRARGYYEKFKKGDDPGLIKIITAMADCKSEEMEKFLSDEYARSPDNIKRLIYNSLTKNKSRIFLETVLGILINKIQTNQPYMEQLNYIKEIDEKFIEKKYDEYQKMLTAARRDRNVVAIEIYSDNIKALSSLLGKNTNETAIQNEVKKIKSEKEREELYVKFIDATMNQELERSFNIFKKLIEKNMITKKPAAERLYNILKELSEIEEKFYKTAEKQDNLMIEIEKEKRAGNRVKVKRLEIELQGIKSNMVLSKRALDRASKRLEVVRELFEEVKIH